MRFVSSYRKEGPSLRMAKPGTFNEHSRRLATSPLADLFGGDHAQPVTIRTLRQRKGGVHQGGDSDLSHGSIVEQRRTGAQADRRSVASGCEAR